MGTINDTAQLRAAYESFNTPPNYGPGDLIRWKAGMKDRRFPDYGEKVICIALNPEHMRSHSREDDGSPYFAERRDMIFGIIREDNGDKDGPTFMQYAADARLFTKAEED